MFLTRSLPSSTLPSTFSSSSLLLSKLRWPRGGLAAASPRATALTAVSLQQALQGGFLPTASAGSQVRSMGRRATTMRMSSAAASRASRTCGMEEKAAACRTSVTS